MTKPICLIMFFGIFMFSIVSCSEKTPDEMEFDELLTISQGVYGQATKLDDVGENDIVSYEGFGIDVFDEPPSTDPDDGMETLVSTETVDQGFYEIELDTGNYCICTTFRRCVSVNVVENRLLRIDYEFGVGPGWSFPLGADNIESEC